MKTDMNDKEIVACAAALMGISMTEFVRMAAQEKAQELLGCRSRITMSTRDFDIFTEALKGAFSPNSAMQHAMKTALNPNKLLCNQGNGKSYQ